MPSSSESSDCTPTSVAARMMYENADPYRMREPSGTLHATDVVYRAPDQETATQLAKSANPLLPHAPLPGEEALPCTRASHTCRS